MKKYELIVFDWDGTLTCTEGIPTSNVRLERTEIRALACMLFGGASRMWRVGRYLEALYARSGASVRVLTKNPVNDARLTDLLCAVAPRIPRTHWTEAGPHDYPGSLGPAYTRRNILHSCQKMATIAALTGLVGLGH